MSNQYGKVSWDDGKVGNSTQSEQSSKEESVEETVESPQESEPTDLTGTQYSSTNVELNSIPVVWTGYTKAAKVQKLVDVIQEQIQRVRSGSFDFGKSYRVAALALEGLMELSEFYADAESSMRNAKNMVDYTESDVATDYYKNPLEKADKKPSEAAIKRWSTCDDKVKDAKSRYVDLDKDYKKWRCIYEILQEAHVFFRGLSKK